jgi:hypothetical protein
MGAGLTDDDWRRLMQEWNVDVLERIPDDMFGEIEASLREEAWLGFPAASEEEVASAESRIGAPLPASYRGFLGYTNGWRRLDATIERLLPAHEIARFIERDREAVLAWTEGAELDQTPTVPDEVYFTYGAQQDVASLRVEYLSTSILVGEGDAYVLLIPEVQTAPEECEAWVLASWLPGAQRFRSFADLMRHIHDQFAEEYPRVRRV